MDDSIIASTFIKEAFHSFKIGDEFTSRMLKEISYSEKLKVTSKTMMRKVAGFIGGQQTTGTLKRIDGKKWSGLQVYEKVGELSLYITQVIDPIPPEYYDFVEMWNLLDVGYSVKCREFRKILDENDIEESYRGQVGKFLWLIASNGWAACKQYRDSSKNIYTRIDSISDERLSFKGRKFMKIRIGPYRSVLDTITTKVKEK